MSTLDEIDARIEPRAGRGQTNAEDLAIASTHTGSPELSPERVPREGAADTSSAERNRKQKRIVEDDSTGEKESVVAAKAASAGDNLQPIMSPKLGDPSDGSIIESKAERLHWWKQASPARCPTNTARLTAALMIMLCAHPAGNECMSPGHVWLPTFGRDKLDTDKVASLRRSAPPRRCSPPRKALERDPLWGRETLYGDERLRCSTPQHGAARAMRSRAACTERARRALQSLPPERTEFTCGERSGRKLILVGAFGARDSSGLRPSVPRAVRRKHAQTCRIRARATRIHRWGRKRETHAYAYFRGRSGHRMAHAVPGGSRKGAQARAEANRTLRHEIDTGNIHHWHTQNILWLKGRLPWHRVMHNA